jgi:nitroreductase
MSADGQTPVRMPFPRVRPEALELLATRRSTKVIHLAAPAPSRAQVEDLLRLASRVPDHGKLAPFRFIVVGTDAAGRFGVDFADAIAARDPQTPEPVLDAARNCLARSPLTVVVVSTAAPHAKIPVWEQELVAGEVCFSLLLAAHASGWGACWLTGPAAYDDAARSLIGLAPGEKIAAFVHIGTATEAQEDRPRPDIGTTTTWL